MSYVVYLRNSAMTPKGVALFLWHGLYERDVMKKHKCAKVAIDFFIRGVVYILVIVVLDSDKSLDV